MVACPHCHVEVLPLADSRCPACRKDVRDLRGTDRTKREISLRQDEPLPASCHECAVATDRRSIVKSEKYDENDPALTAGSSVALRVLGVVAGLLTGTFLFVRGRTKQAMVVEIRIPHCADCAGHHGKPEPRHVDFLENTMTFVVHKKFRSALYRAREAREQALDPQR
jgi:hypothetical protein